MNNLVSFTQLFLEIGFDAEVEQFDRLFSISNQKWLGLFACLQFAISVSAPPSRINYRMATTCLPRNLSHMQTSANNIAHSDYQISQMSGLGCHLNWSMQHTG